MALVWATPYHTGRAILCIGNFTIGGAGKTPVVMFCAEAFKRHKPAILSRGYGGKLRNVQVQTDTHTTDEVGDEALLMAQTTPVYIGAKRRETARLAIKNGAGLLLMDDGMQNPHLRHQCNLAVIDAAVGLGNERVMPAGPLRRAWQEDLAQAHALLLIEAESRHPSVTNLLREARKQDVPIFSAKRSPDLSALPKGKAVYAFCGLARPNKFFAALQDSGVKLAETQAFPDHHRYTEQEAAQLLANANARSLQLITTAKDAIRLRAPALQFLRKEVKIVGDKIAIANKQDFLRFLSAQLSL